MSTQFYAGNGRRLTGTYRLAFTRGGTQVLVDVVIRPSTSAEPGQDDVRMSIDEPSAEQTITGPLTVAGWAVDPQAPIGTGIDAVHVWAFRRDVAGEAPQFLGAGGAGRLRPDVAQALEWPPFVQAGFSLTTDALAPGEYDLVVYVWSHRTHRWQDARSVRIRVR